MDELISTGLVRPMGPGTFVRRIPEFDDHFLTLLDAYELPALFPQGASYDQRQHRKVFHPGQWTRLHVEKASLTLFAQLQDRGLAVPLNFYEGYMEWWAVENRTAGLYMAYLVGAVCRNDRTLFPVTDTIYSLSSLIGPVGHDVDSRLSALRYAVITQALPVPSRLVSAGEIASFKDRHGEQLRRLRSHLNGQLVSLAGIDDDFMRDAMVEDTLQEIHDDVAVLTEQMSRRRWPRIVLVGVGGLVASALTIGTAVASGGTALALGLGITGGLASVGPAGYQAVNLIRSPRFDEHSPLAYAALAQSL